jgi:hypothetical protein
MNTVPALVPSQTVGTNVAPRAPDMVMRLARMGSFHASRLSFMRALLRRITREAWRFERSLWEVDAKGVGRAVYCVHAPQRSYSLVAFAHELPEAMRSDRVIATAWDATFTLFDGVPTEQDLQRLQTNVPKQEAGRISDSELTLARANRSVRLWAHVIERLAMGQQPDPALVQSVGYLMRTTAVYGSGKFGAADRAAIADRAELKAPFRAEMLTVWLIRAFTLDLVEHMARQQGGELAVPLTPALRRRFGVGNSTGLGMAPFLLNHPVLLHRWMAAREQALCRVRGLGSATAQAVQSFGAALHAAQRNAIEWHSEHAVQMGKLEGLRADLDRLAQHVDQGALVGVSPWDRLYRWAENELSLEGQEQLVSLMMEPYGELVDDLADDMDAEEVGPFTIVGGMRLGALRALLQQHYAWATVIDFAQPDGRARFWYVSEEKLEPRLGERDSEEGAALELPLCVAQQVQDLVEALSGRDDGQTVAEFLLTNPQHRQIVRRVQMAEQHPYAEVHDNLIAADMLPIDLLRCKLSFFGATRFDPRSDRWVRISMYQDAPFPHELCANGSAHGPKSAPGRPVLADTNPEDFVRYTLSEIEALSRKAARGSGFDWGLADEAGKAARWLSGHGLPGAQVLAQLLTRNDGKPFALLCPVEAASGPWHARSAELCPLIAGACLADRAAQLVVNGETHLGPVANPLLTLPFVARAVALTGNGLQVSWPGVRVDCLVDGIIIMTSDPSQLAAELAQSVTVRALAAPTGTPCAPVHVAQPVATSAWQVLTRLAHRTLVPATEASRAGAGASTRDAD